MTELIDKVVARTIFFGGAILVGLAMVATGVLLGYAIGWVLRLFFPVVS